MRQWGWSRILTWRLKRTRFSVSPLWEWARKSTMIKIFVSQLNPECTTFSVFGMIRQKDKFEALKKLTYCSQNKHLLATRQSVQNLLRFFISISIKAKACHKEFLNSKFSPKSSSQLDCNTQTKLSCAIAFKNINPLIVMEELTAGVNVLARKSM